MEKIKLSDIDLSSLTKSKNQGTKSVLYENGDTCIKIFNDSSEDEKVLLYRKFLEMEELSISDVLFPTGLIVEDDKLQGYIMENFKDSINLYDYFTSSRYVNCKDIFKAVKKASFILRSIHSTGIVCQDLSFDNILIDREGNIKYCDVDGYAYNGNMSPYVSILLKRFLFDYRKDKNCVVSENTDRISFMLSFFYLMYLKEVQEISKRNYRSLSDHIRTLENMRKHVKALVNKRGNLPDMPYMDELIYDTDDYTIDRVKQLSLRQKFLRKF